MLSQEIQVGQPRLDARMVQRVRRSGFVEVALLAGRVDVDRLDAAVAIQLVLDPSQPLSDIRRIPFAASIGEEGVHDSSDGSIHPGHGRGRKGRCVEAGELVIGVNPPFGHLNQTAIEFVQHALCAQVRAPVPTPVRGH